MVTALLVLFGEIGPKTVALQHNWAFARAYGPPLALWGTVARPLIAALDLASRAVLALVGQREGAPSALTPGELRTAIHLGAETGAVEEQASGVMLGALGLSERSVQAIMVHRSNVVALEAHEPVSLAAELLTENGYLRLPVYEDGARQHRWLRPRQRGELGGGSRPPRCARARADAPAAV